MRRSVTLVPVAVVAIVGLVAVVCTGISGAATDSGPGSTTPTTSSILNRPKRIVQLGDSIASGEGTLYGYTYDAKKKVWTGGNVDVKWPPPYPDCHVSPDAYGHRVAASFQAPFSQFACTGATFANGIVGPAVSGSKVRRPPEFGDWTTKKGLNEEYEDAHPDLVLVTLGADDAQFSDVVENCIKNAYKYSIYLAKEECIPSNPGVTLQKDFFDFLPTLRQNYATLVRWINERASYKTVGARPPKIVFTTYANPFPDPGTKCNDVNYLYPEQITYLSSLVDQMNATILQSIPTLGSGNVAVADISNVYRTGGQDHLWCSSDPWAYGLSIYSVYHPSSFNSLAPFHPTPQGQQAITEAVRRTVLALFNPHPGPTPTSPTSAVTTTTASSTTTTSSPAPTTTTP